MQWLVGALPMLLADGSTNAVEIHKVDAKQPTNLATAIFAGGSFWREEAVFDSVPGVVSVTSGYTGGVKANPTCEKVSGGGPCGFDADCGTAIVLNQDRRIITRRGGVA